MRYICVLMLVLTVSACASSLEKQTSAGAQSSCWQQAEDYIRANMSSIANEWRQHEKYKHYQRCLAERVNGQS